MRIDFAEWTRQGSAWFGEFNILREYSFDEAMTIKLGARSVSDYSMQKQGRDLHVEYANGTKSSRVPLSHVALHSGFHRIGKFSDDWNGPCRAWEMFFLVPVHRLLEDEKGGDDGKGGVKPSCLVGGGEEERGNGNVNEGGGGGGRTWDGGGIMAKEGRHDELVAKNGRELIRSKSRSDWPQKISRWQTS